MCEDVYTYHQRCVKLDKNNKENGNELDEFGAHQLIEKCDDALTVQKMRQVLKEVREGGRYIYSKRKHGNRIDFDNVE